MFVEDDGWEEEEVVHVDEDEALSDLDSDHADMQGSFSDYFGALDVILCYLM